MNDLNLASKIVNEILEDLTGRGGFDGVWCDLDEDIQEEILNEWASIIRKNLKEQK